MCLATVYGKKKEGESILIKNASRMDVDGTTASETLWVQRSK